MVWTEGVIHWCILGVSLRLQRDEVCGRARKTSGKLQECLLARLLIVFARGSKPGVVHLPSCTWWPPVHYLEAGERRTGGGYAEKKLEESGVEGLTTAGAARRSGMRQKWKVAGRVWRSRFTKKERKKKNNKVWITDWVTLRVFKSGAETPHWLWRETSGPPPPPGTWPQVATSSWQLSLPPCQHFLVSTAADLASSLNGPSSAHRMRSPPSLSPKKAVGEFLENNLRQFPSESPRSLFQVQLQGREARKKTASHLL